MDDTDEGMSQTMSQDYSAWLTKEEAAARLGVSTKTVERLGHRLGHARWLPPGKAVRIVVYRPDDVADLAAERQPAASPVILGPDRTASPSPTNGHTHPAAAGAGALALVRPGDGDVLGQVLQAVLTRLTTPVSETSETLSRAFLTVPEAAAATGLSEPYLRRAIRAGTLPAVRDRAWKIRRRDLEAL